MQSRIEAATPLNQYNVRLRGIPVVQFSDQLTDGKPPLIRAGNRPTDSRKTDLMTVGKPSPNQTNINLSLIHIFPTSRRTGPSLSQPESWGTILTRLLSLPCSRRTPTELPNRPKPVSYTHLVSNLVGLVGCPAASLAAFSLSRAS